jgi:predicted metallopeptidase
MSLVPPQPRQSSRPQPSGFDFTLHMHRLCDDITSRLEPLRHIEMAEVAISFSQTRKATRHGMYASLTPMRFAGGKTHTVRGGRRWGVQRLYGRDGREILYILSFYLPRFLDLAFREKVSTVIHELWHIGPRFDGDLRRLGGRCFAHGVSQKHYDARVERLVDRWLSLTPPESACAFLQFSYRELSARHGRIFGRKIPAPKLIPLS